MKKTVIRTQIRKGVYFDSVRLMRLQSDLLDREGITKAAVLMGTPANKDLLSAQGLLSDESSLVQPDDLAIVLEAADNEAAEAAFSEIDRLLSASRGSASSEYRPRRLSSALRLRPDARWVSISVAGRYAGKLCREALEHDRNVFLFSDNVEIAEEIALKRLALEKGLLVMGPDCGTAIVNGVGFGFANRVRQGNIGLVGASGTGLQAVTSLIHQLGGGVSHAIGTGGRDLKAEVGAATTLQAFDLLQRDSETESIVLVSKPPDRETIPVLERMLRASAKPVVLYLQGGTPFLHGLDQVYVAATLSQTAFLATKLTGHRDDGTPEALVNGSGFLRGLFAGGTLAQESAERLSPVLDGLQTNVSVGAEVLAAARGHSILDLGADEFTVGRLHPMIDPALRLDLIEQEASDPDVSLILLDVVLGDGSDPNPAAGIAAIIQDFRSRDRSKRSVEFVVMMVGTEEDPQNIERQTRALESAGARVFSDPSAALGFVEGVFRRPVHSDVPSVPLSALDASMSVVNIGLESFYESFVAQGANALQMDWSPPAEGDSRMQDILRKLTS